VLLVPSCRLSWLSAFQHTLKNKDSAIISYCSIIHLVIGLCLVIRATIIWYWVHFTGQQQRSFNRPRMLENRPAAAPALSPTTPSWSSSPGDKYPQFPSQTKSFSPPSQRVDDRPSILQQHADLIATYPAPRQKPAPPATLTGLIKPTGSAPKPGAGYSYQGIV